MSEESEMKFKDEDGNEMTLPELLNGILHEPQPHTISGERGQQIIKLKNIEICECFLRGMLDAGTHYAKDNDYKVNAEMLSWHHLIDLIYQVRWRKDFDPVAIVQCASIHLEKVLGVYPNVPKLEEQENE